MLLYKIPGMWLVCLDLAMGLKTRADNEIEKTTSVLKVGKLKEFTVLQNKVNGSNMKKFPYQNKNLIVYFAGFFCYET